MRIMMMYEQFVHLQEIQREHSIALVVLHQPNKM